MKSETPPSSSSEDSTNPPVQAYLSETQSSSSSEDSANPAVAADLSETSPSSSSENSATPPAEAHLDEKNDEDSPFTNPLFNEDIPDEKITINAALKNRNTRILGLPQTKVHIVDIIKKNPKAEISDQFFITLFSQIERSNYPIDILKILVINGKKEQVKRLLATALLQDSKYQYLRNEINAYIQLKEFCETELNNHEEIAKSLMQGTADANLFNTCLDNTTGETLLHRLAKKGSFVGLQIAAHCEADFNLTDSQKKTPLVYVLEDSKTPESSIYELLLKKSHISVATSPLLDNSALLSETWKQVRDTIPADDMKTTFFKCYKTFSFGTMHSYKRQPAVHLISALPTIAKKKKSATYKAQQLICLIYLLEKRWKATSSKEAFHRKFFELYKPGFFGVIGRGSMKTFETLNPGNSEAFFTRIKERIKENSNSATAKATKRMFGG